MLQNPLNCAAKSTHLVFSSWLYFFFHNHIHLLDLRRRRRYHGALQREPKWALPPFPIRDMGGGTWVPFSRPRRWLDLENVIFPLHSAVTRLLQSLGSHVIQDISRIFLYRHSSNVSQRSLSSVLRHKLPKNGASKYLSSGLHMLEKTGTFSPINCFKDLRGKTG